MPLFALAHLDFDSTKKVHYIGTPVLYKSPETGWAFGLSGAANFKTSFKSDTLTRMSTVSAVAIFSEKQQNIQDISATIYFPKEKYILYYQSSHSYFPDNFWGIGQYTKNEDVERYVFEHLTLKAHLKRKFYKHLFFGVMGDYQNVFKIQYLPEGIMASSSFYGKSNYNTLGLGLSASFDSRNSTFWPTKGMFLQTQFTTYNKGLISDYSFNKWLTEIRFFKQVFKKHIIAVQLYNCTNIGQTPYRSMVSLGGAENLRGFYRGRFRDNSMYSAIVEYRAPLFWRISACVFGGVGDVYSDFKAINSNSLKHSFGGGLRLTVLKKENLNLRIDYGYSDSYNQGFYFTIGECF